MFGPVTAQALPWDISHDAERRNYAELALEFVVAGLDAPFFSRSWPKADAKADTARSAAAAVLGALTFADANAAVRSGLRSLAGLKARPGGAIPGGADLFPARSGAGGGGEGGGVRVRADA